MLLGELPQSGVDLATKDDLVALEQRLDARFDRVDDRFELMELRMVGLRDEVIAAFRGELVAAVSRQTPQVIVATATAVFGIGGLAVTLAQVL